MRRLALVSLLLLACCADDSTRRHRELEAFDRERTASIARYTEIRRQFESRNQMPLRLDLGEDGTLIVLECRLEGIPDEEAFWLKYTWINTSKHAVRGVEVTIVLRDPASGREQREEVLLDPPLGGALGRDSSYTTFLRMPLKTVPVSADLQWEIRVRALVAGT
jgi:hypothetical protein